MVHMLISTARRLALKIASYGVMHLVVAILVAFAITRDWRVALAVGVVEPFFQTIPYSIHDRVSHRIERRRMLSNLEEASEAFNAHLQIMAPAEQTPAHGHDSHSPALPGNLAVHADARIMTMRSNATVWGLVVLGVAFAIAEVVLIVSW